MMAFNLKSDFRSFTLKAALLTAIGLLLLLSGPACNYTEVNRGEDYYRSSDEDFMAALKKEMDASGFEYRVDEEGYIRFIPEDQARFSVIEKNLRDSGWEVLSSWSDGSEGEGKLEKSLEYSRGIKHENRKLMEVLKQELDAAGVENIMDKDGFIRYQEKDEKRFKELDALAYAMISTRHTWGEDAGEIDQDYLAVLRKELEPAGVVFSIEDEDVIRFQSGDRKAFESILVRVGRLYHQSDGTSTSDKKHRERIIRLLEDEGVEYLVYERKGVDWISWHVEDKAKKDEIWKKITRRNGDCPGKMKEASRPDPTSQLALNQNAHKSCSS